MPSPPPNIGRDPPDATANTRLASVAQGHQRYPYRRKRRPIPPDWYSVADAAYVLGIDRVNVRRYCETIKGFAIRDGERGLWWVDPIVLAIVGKLRIVCSDRLGRLPHGTLVAETERRAELMRATLTLLHRPDATEEQVASIARRIRRASRTRVRRSSSQKAPHHDATQTERATGPLPPVARMEKVVCPSVANPTCASPPDSATAPDQRPLIATAQPDDRHRRPPPLAQSEGGGDASD